MRRSGNAAAFIEFALVTVLRRYSERVAERKEQLERTLARVAELCRNDPTILAAYVYGSYVTGKIGPTSDLDLLVVRETALPRSVRSDDLLLAVKNAVPLDVLVVTPQELAERLPTTTFGATILATMRRIDAA